MEASKRIVVNTIAQYSRTLINVLLSLYSARLVLLALGKSDFGIYSLVGGVVSLLSFLTNSLVMSTQRFLSVQTGTGDVDKVKEIFNNSLILHLMLGIAVVVVLELLAPLFFNGFLNIPSGREDAALTIYHFVVLMLLLSFLTAPFRALFISHENIVYISVVDVLDGVLKFVLVLLLPYATVDKLIVYAIIMTAISAFNMLALAVYAYCKYEECVWINFKRFHWGYVRQLSSFTGWILYSNFCIVGRNQGLAIVLNKLLGTVANAAYGFGIQIAGYISFVSSSFSTAIAPQLMKAKGVDDKEHMLYLAEIQSKVSYLLLALFTIPIVFEIQTILELWLKIVPENTATFSIMVLVGILVDQPTQGLVTTFQALGKLRLHSLFAYTPKLLLLPVSFLLLFQGFDVAVVAWSFILIEFGCMLLRLPLMKHVYDFDMKKYAKNVFRSIPVPTLLSVLTCWGITFLPSSPWRILVTFPAAMLVFMLSAYMFSTTADERNKIRSMASIAKSKLIK